jgi:hypothetical protein
MSTQTIRLLIAAVLFLHGLAHIGPTITLLLQPRGVDTGGWRPAKSWLLPSLNPSVAKWLAILLWMLSLVFFIGAALSFWGVWLVDTSWRWLALVGAIPSTFGILLFLGTWPAFNTLAALAVDVAVIVTQLGTHWPSEAMFGK